MTRHARFYNLLTNNKLMTIVRNNVVYIYVQKKEAKLPFFCRTWVLVSVILLKVTL